MPLDSQNEGEGSQDTDPAGIALAGFEARRAAWLTPRTNNGKTLRASEASIQRLKDVLNAIDTKRGETKLSNAQVIVSTLNLKRPLKNPMPLGLLVQTLFLCWHHDGTITEEMIREAQQHRSGEQPTEATVSRDSVHSSPIAEANMTSATDLQDVQTPQGETIVASGSATSPLQTTKTSSAQLHPADQPLGAETVQYLCCPAHAGTRPVRAFLNLERLQVFVEWVKRIEQWRDRTAACQAEVTWTMPPARDSVTTAFVAAQRDLQHIPISYVGIDPVERQVLREQLSVAAAQLLQDPEHAECVPTQNLVWATSNPITPRLATDEMICAPRRSGLRVSQILAASVQWQVIHGQARSASDAIVTREKAERLEALYRDDVIRIANSHHQTARHGAIIQARALIESRIPKPLPNGAASMPGTERSTANLDVASGAHRNRVPSSNWWGLGERYWHA